MGLLKEFYIKTLSDNCSIASIVRALYKELCGHFIIIET